VESRTLRCDQGVVRGGASTSAPCLLQVTGYRFGILYLGTQPDQGAYSLPHFDLIDILRLAGGQQLDSCPTCGEDQPSAMRAVPAQHLLETEPVTVKGNGPVEVLYG